MGEEITFSGPDGELLSGYIEEPAKPAGKGVVLLHCFLCTKHHRIMRNLASTLAQHGITTLRFDFAGNGKSGGKLEETTYTRMIGETKAAVSVLEARGIRHVGVAGHSLGAMIGLLCAYEDERIRAVAFIAGSSQAARVKEVFPPDVLEKAERDGSSEAHAFGRDITITRGFLRDIDRYDVRKSASSLDKPILITHGTADEVIDYAHARQLSLWAKGDRTLLPIEGADHLFRDEEHLSLLMGGVCSWFAEKL